MSLPRAVHPALRCRSFSSRFQLPLSANKTAVAAARSPIFVRRTGSLSTVVAANRAAAKAGPRAGGKPKHAFESWQKGDVRFHLVKDEWTDEVVAREDKQFTIVHTRPEPRVPTPRVDGKDILVFSDRAKRFVVVPRIWLRDNCQCANCVHQVTRQRLWDTFAISNVIEVESVEQGDHGIFVHWMDGHQSYYRHEILAKAAVKNPGNIRLGLTTQALWGSTIGEEPPTVEYDAIMSSDKGLAQWLFKIRKYGFSYVDGCPATPEATEKLLRRIAFVRETHYGGFYDFTADLASADTAYTNIALDAHTDTTYFSDPAGLQMFHLLEHTDGAGGTSLLVDGFAAAKTLREEDPQAYEILSTVGVYAHASGNEGISIQPYRPFPVLLHDEEGELIQVRWNNSDRAALDMPVEETGKWYEAAEKWATILRSHRLEYWSQMQPGKPLIFDNWRVLHGRSSFTGRRRICGGYINRDDFLSRFRSRNWSHEKVRRLLPTAA